MPLDAICLTALKNELTEQVVKCRIDKVSQPERDVLILSLRNKTRQAYKLLISTGTGDSRVHLTEHKFENPGEPPMFCMLLRKHLTGAVISQILQPQAERVLVFVLETSSALGERLEKRLIFETVGRISNLIITDSDGVIIDCMRRFGGDANAKRLVLPGLLYREPPAQEGKLDPQGIDSDKFMSLITSAAMRPTVNSQLLSEHSYAHMPHPAPNERTPPPVVALTECSGSNSLPTVERIAATSVSKWLSSQFTAMSPLICREIAYRAYGDVDIRFDEISDDYNALCQEFFILMDKVKASNFEPWLIQKEDGTFQDFSYTKISQYESFCKTSLQAGFSGMLDVYFTRTAQTQRTRQKISSTLKTAKTLGDRLVRKMIAQTSELEDTARRDTFRQNGDIIMANLHLIKRGQTTLKAEDFYSEPGSCREIKLDPQKSPQQNAALYYKRYTKAKNARKFLEQQLQFGRAELLYIESILEQLGRVENEQDLLEIRRELVQAGYIKKQSKQKVKQAEQKPLCFTSSTGMQLRVGRNNIQNDKLTFKHALKYDVWLHAQKIHGAHVIISCEGKEPDDVTLGEAASLAAYYSAGRSGSKIPVDYTFVRYVKKLPGNRPGMVTYTDFKTIIAEPRLL